MSFLEADAKTISDYFPFWDKLSNDERETILSYTSVVKFSRGQNVHSGSNDCVGVILVKSGMLRTYMLSDQGKEITLYRLFPGDVCVLSASCMISSITFDIFIDAEEESEILLVASSAFSEIASRNIYVECFIYKMTAARFSDVMWAMQQILFTSFDRRLAVFLTDELSKTGGDTVKMTHEQVAKYMGSAREVVTRMLNYFASEGIVSLSRGGITVTDRKKLRKLATG